MRVIYIMGAGRSGTTLLDIVLGNTKGCLSGGELRWIWGCRGEAPNRDEGEVRTFWRKVYRQLSSKQIKVRLFGFLESHYMIPVAIILNLLRVNIPNYTASHRALFKLASEEAGAECVIDSSKYPGRALLLESALDDMTLVYIIKSRASVVRSFMNKSVDQPTKSYVAANIYWVLMRIACELCYRLSGADKVKIYYEELQRDFPRTIKEITSVASVDEGGLIARVVAGQPLSPGYVFQGNRMRLNKEIYFRRI